MHGCSVDSGTIRSVRWGDTPFGLPEWLGSWFEIYPVWETLTAQALAAAFVIGSYYAAEYVKVKRPQKRGQPVTAVRATAAPAEQ